MGMYVVWRPEIFSKNHESFRTIEDLRDKIKENRSEIENIKAQIRSLSDGNTQGYYSCRLLAS